MAAGGAVIGALRVVIGADTAALDKGLKNAQSRVSQFGSSFGGLGKTLAAGLAAGVTALGGIALAVKSTVSEMDRLLEISQQIGIPVEELSALKYAAELSGVSIDQLSTAMGKLSKNIVEAATNTKSKAAGAFKDLGINARNADGSLKSVSQVTTEMADRFVKADNDVGKTSASLELFGKSGKELIPLLNAGGAGIRAMMLEAAQLGLVFSTQTAQGADKFNDTLTALSKLKNGIIIQLTSALLPALQRFAQFMLDGANKTNLVKNAAAFLTRVFDGLIRVTIVVYDNLALLAKIMGIIIVANIATSILKGAYAFILLAKATQAAGLFMAAFDAIRKRALFGILLLAGGVALATGQLDNLKEKLGKIGQTIIDAMPEGTGDAFKNAIKALGFDLSGLEKQLGEFDPSGGGAKKALDNIKRSGEDAKEATDKAKKSLEQLKEEGRSVFEETRTPAELFVEKMKELDVLLHVGAVSAETYARKMSMLKNEMIKATPAAQILEQALTSAFDRFLDFSLSAIEQLKLFGRELAKLAAMAAFKALFFGPSQGTSGSGLIGGLLGSAISGGMLPTFARGGSFKVGGSGGTDSQLVAFKATPREQVNIRTPGQQREMNNPVNVNTPVRVVNAFDTADFLSRALEGSPGEKLILNWVSANRDKFRGALA